MQGTIDAFMLSMAYEDVSVWKNIQEYVVKFYQFIFNKLLPAAELQIQKRKLKQMPTKRLQPQPQNVLMYVTKNIFRI